MNAQWKFNKERFEFTFSDQSDYLGGITIFEAIIIRKTLSNKIWTLDIPLTEITCENSAIYTLDIPDANAKTTGFIPKVPYHIVETASEFKIDLNIKPGNPAQFLDDVTHLSGSEYAHPGIYQGKFLINVYIDNFLYDQKVITYKMDLKQI